MRFKLEIELDQSVILGKSLDYVSEQIARSFAQYGKANNGTRGDRQPGDAAAIKDINGNTVGKWEVIGDQPIDNLPKPKAAPVKGNSDYYGFLE
jgi:hypothetical protein